MSNGTIGMLYLVHLRAVRKRTHEKIKSCYLLVGCEEADITRKLAYLVDLDAYCEFSIKSIEKVRSKAHLLYETTVQDKPAADFVEKRDERTVEHFQSRGDGVLKHFRIGIALTVGGLDENHALRRLATYLTRLGGGSKAHQTCPVSSDAIIHVEEIAERSGYAMPRDVSNTVGKAVIFRG